MMRLVLYAIFIEWGLLFLYFANRFRKRRMLGSLVAAFSCIGWPLFIAREFHLLARSSAVPFVAAALTFGTFGVIVIFIAEGQRPKPFK
jgi:hypothetical protein